MSEEIILKPCPFCGTQAKISYIKKYWPACQTQRCIDGPFFDTPEAAASWWNTRHVPEFVPALPPTEAFAELRQRFGDKFDDAALEETQP